MCVCRMCWRASILCIVWCRVPGVGITDELSNGISYDVCAFDDAPCIVCCVGVAISPVQVPLTQEHQNDESAPCLTVQDGSNLSTVSMNDVSDVASLIILILTPAELSP